MNTSERDALIVSHLKLVTTIATDFASAAKAAGVQWDDVLGSGALGLVKAADHYRPGKMRFSIYCRRWVRGAIRRELRLNRPLTTGIDVAAIADHRRPRVPTLEPLFPITSFVPASACPHHGPLRRRTVFVCAVCHTTAYENHPDLQIGATDVHPGRRRRHAADLPQPKFELTRRERRLRLFGAKSA